MQSKAASQTNSISSKPIQHRTLLIAGAVIIVVIAGWYLFRPERLFINHMVNETFPVSTVPQRIAANPSSTVVSQGRFHGVAHGTKGLATIHQLANGKRILRLTDFETSNGPDVQVYLVAAADANDNETVTRAGFFHLGALKGNIGDQNYEVPSEVELNKYQSVTIWCRRFGVNFGTAPLDAKRS
jgi:hypothetical protein